MADLSKMAAFYTVIESVANEVEDRVEFGALDNKGKMIGALVKTREQVMVSAEGHGETGPWYVLTPGLKYAARVQTLRGGKEWGCYNGPHFFETAAERDQYVARQLRALKNRAVYAHNTRVERAATKGA